MKIRKTLLATCLVLPLAAAGCSSSNNNDQAGKNAAAGYPVTVASCGKDYTYKEAPKRVVVMNGGSVAEATSLIALGQDKAIIANAQNYGTADVPGLQEKIDALPKGGIKLNEMQDIPREAMIGLRPDLVVSTYEGGFAADSGFASKDDLAEIGASTYVPANNCGEVGKTTGSPTIEKSYDMLRDLGTIFGAKDKADKLIDESKKSIADTAAKVKGKPVKNVLVVFPNMGMGGDDDLSAIGRNGVWNDILAKAGAKNPFDDPAGQSIGTIGQDALATTPVDALVVVNYMNPDPEATAKRIFDRFPQWEASKNKRSVVLSDSIYFGPNNAVAVDRIARSVHSEAF